MKRFLAFVIFLLLCDCVSAYRQEYFSFRHLTVDHGLSNNLVDGICQDTLGRMWIGTNHGINCFDGYNLTVYKHDPYVPNTLPSNIINSMYADRNGDIWACTANGLALFDYCTGYFKRIEMPGEVSYIEYITQISDQLYVVCSRDETFFYDRLKNVAWPCIVNGEELKFYSIVEHNGDIVAGTIGTKQVLSLRYEDGCFVLCHPPVDMPHNITTLLNAPNGSVWVGLVKGGLCLVDFKTGKVSAPDEFIPSSMSVEALEYDAKGRLWVGTHDGLYIMDVVSRTVAFLADETPASSHLSHSSIRSLYCDNTGGMWVGTEYGGVNYWSARQKVFKALQYSTTSSANDRIVTSIHKGEGHTLWIGTRHGGLYHYSLANGRTQNYQIDNIRSVFLSRGKVLVGTSVGGWAVINPQIGKMRRISRPSDVNCFQEAPGGCLWLGGLAGLYLYNPRTNTTVKVDISPDGKLWRVLSLYYDNRGVLWVGAKEGLRRFRVADDCSLEEIRDTISDKIVQVQCLFEANDSTVWIGTADGLYRYDRETAVMTFVNDVSGLRQSSIRGIEEDAKGNLWISTDNGLARYDYRRSESRLYSVRDGLLSNQFTSYSAHCSDDFGNLYFGSVGGVTWFNPEEVLDNNRTCPPVITGLRLFNVDVKPGDQTGVLQKHITLTDDITLDHDQNTITISFTCPDYVSEGYNSFRYMMEGIDDGGWIKATSKSVTYSNLDKGTYKFVLSSSNSDGVWNPRTDELLITVRPIWYRTVVAKVFFLLLTLCVIAYAMYWLKKRLDARNQEKINMMERKNEEDLKRAKVASYVQYPYLLRQVDLDFVETALNCIGANLNNPQFSVEMLASMMNMTRSNLHLKVKSITGTSPVDIIRRVRVENACHLIRNGYVSMSEIAAEVGFNSLSYFTVVFKKVTGLTPGEYASGFNKNVNI